MSHHDVVSYEVRDHVAWLTIDRPEARNALNVAVRQGLFAGFGRFAEDTEARVLVLTGTGDKAFCAGADLKEMRRQGLRIPPPDFLPQIGRNIEIAKPVIGAINGACLAGGFLLAQNCDLLVAADHATFGITEVRVGRGAPWAVPLTAMVPRAIAMELLLTGRPISAHRAHEVGLVNRVVPAAELVATAQDLATQIAENAPLSVLAAKRTVGLLASDALGRAFDAAERIWEPVYLSDDAQEGPAAFAEGRPPSWTGT